MTVSDTAWGAPPVNRAFFDARQQTARYVGPGREIPEPDDLSEILIGYFGPSDPSHPDSGHMWQAAQWAVEEANRQGGYRGKPFRLVPGWSKDPWGTGVVRVTRMAYADRVWAIIGGIDGPSTHLAEQVVAKARLTLLSPGSTDKTVNLANVPWMFSCLPGDHRQAAALAEAISSRVAGKPLVLASADDHDSHHFAVELAKHLTARRLVLKYRFDYRQGTERIAELSARIVQTRPDAVVLVGGARDAARLVVSVRRGGFSGLVFGGPSMGQTRFLEEASAASEGVVFPLLYYADPSSDRFAKDFRNRFGRPPDYLAAQTYDAVGIVVAAIRKAGLNRAQIRDAVAKLSPWTGVAGHVTWDGLGSNTRAVRVGTIQAGRVVPVPLSGLAAEGRILDNPTPSEAVDRETTVDHPGHGGRIAGTSDRIARTVRPHGGRTPPTPTWLGTRRCRRPIARPGG